MTPWKLYTCKQKRLESINGVFLAILAQGERAAKLKVDEMREESEVTFRQPNLHFKKWKPKIQTFVILISTPIGLEYIPLWTNTPLILNHTLYYLYDFLKGKPTHANTGTLLVTFLKKEHGKLFNYQVTAEELLWECTLKQGKFSCLERSGELRETLHLKLKQINPIKTKLERNYSSLTSDILLLLHQEFSTQEDKIWSSTTWNYQLQWDLQFHWLHFHIL